MCSSDLLLIVRTKLNVLTGCTYLVPLIRLSNLKLLVYKGFLGDATSAYITKHLQTLPPECRLNKISFEIRPRLNLHFFKQVRDSLLHLEHQPHEIEINGNPYALTNGGIYRVTADDLQPVDVASVGLDPPLPPLPYTSLCGQLPTDDGICYQYSGMYNAKLPIELCEEILDWLGVAVEDRCVQPNWKQQEALLQCVQVCRAWQPRCRRYLRTRISIRYTNVRSFRNVLHGENGRFELLSELDIDQDRSPAPITSILALGRFHNLKKFIIRYFYFGQEHQPLIEKSIPEAMPNVTSLQLWEVEQCKVSQVISLVNSFPSLSSLCISFNCSDVVFDREDPPTPSIQPLGQLDIVLVPGVSGILQWVLGGNLIRSFEGLTLRRQKVREEIDLFAAIMQPESDDGFLREIFRDSDVFGQRKST